MKTSDIINDALLLIGESPELCNWTAGDPITGASLRRRLELVIEDSAREAMLTLPAEHITEFRSIPSVTLSADSFGCARLPLPSDFLRLGSMRLQSWHRPVTEVIPAGHWLRRLQRIPWTGLRATNNRPMAFLSAGADGRRVLELYGCTHGDTIAEGWYVPEPKIIDGEIRIPPRAYMKCLNHMVATMRTYETMR